MSKASRPITVRLPIDIVTELETEAIQMGMSRSETVTRRLRRCAELARELQILRQQDQNLTDDQPLGEVLK